MIRISGIKKLYNGLPALNINELEFGRFRYALVGANGAGKSTLLKIIAGILKPECGTAVIENNQKVVYMPQKSMGFNMSVAANFKISSPNYLAAAQRLNLTALLKKNAGALSGGETQRVALVRTLLAKSDILLLDEPTSATDMENAAVAEEMIIEQNKPLIFATHSLAQAERLADYIVFMDRGEIVEVLPAAEFKNSQNERTVKFLNRY